MEYDSTISFNAQKSSLEVNTHVYTHTATLIITKNEIYTYMYIYPGTVVTSYYVDVSVLGYPLILILLG